MTHHSRNNHVLHTKPGYTFSVGILLLVLIFLPLTVMKLSKNNGSSLSPVNGVFDALNKESSDSILKDIEGMVFSDVNGNAVYDAGIDSTLQNVQLTLTSTRINQQALSASNGMYSMKFNENGTYMLTVGVPEGYTMRDPNPITLQLSLQDPVMYVAIPLYRDTAAE